MSKHLTVGSTFTGIGGADLGFEWAGFDIKWQCEYDSWKQEVLRAHWPDVPLYADITTMSEAPSVDVMLGGFPCQDLSVAGKRKGFGGERSVLAFEFLRVAELVQPRWIVLENVPGLLSSNGGRDFARLVDEVVGCGYGVAWRILDARYFAVPQRRRRVFIVARRTDAKYDSRGASRLALRALFESGGGDTSSGWQAWTETPRSTRASSEECGSVGGVMGDVSHALTKASAKGATEDGTGRGTPIVGTHGRVDEGPTGTLTRMYSEQSGQDFGGGAGVIATGSTTPPPPSEPGEKNARLER
jgi:DNA-cytosine methyltransferase